MVKERNIVLCIVLSIVTCGLYGIYWFVVLHNDMNTLTPGDAYQTSGAMALVLTLVSCGIYGWYWAYKMGEKVDMLTSSQDHKILFIVLQFFGLGIVNYCIMQDLVNKNANAKF